jgi:hypothetical protein
MYRAERPARHGLGRGAGPCRPRLRARATKQLDEVSDVGRVPETCRIGRRFGVTQGNVAVIDCV